MRKKLLSGLRMATPSILSVHYPNPKCAKPEQINNINTGEIRISYMLTVGVFTLCPCKRKRNKHFWHRIREMISIIFFSHPAQRQVQNTFSIAQRLEAGGIASLAPYKNTPSNQSCSTPQDVLFLLPAWQFSPASNLCSLQAKLLPQPSLY